MTELFKPTAIVASAGSGKTYEISGRMIALLAADESAESVFASTFTRKAAGEILDRVLGRLAAAAIDADAAAALNEQIQRSDLTSADYAELLAGVTGALHRLNIGTLDSFIVRAATCFGLELDLRPGWTIAEPLTDERIRIDALTTLLAEADPQTMITLLRETGRGETDRSVHDRLLDLTRQLHGVYRQATDEAWQTINTTTRGLMKRPDLEQAIHAWTELDLPLTQSGQPNRAWEKAVGQIVDAAWNERFDELLDITLVERVVQGEEKYNGKPIGDDVSRWVWQILSHARAALQNQLAGRAKAMRSLMVMFDHYYRAAQRRRGTYRFDDLTEALGGEAPLLTRPDVYERLDARTRHILLDEFQDTSTQQWTALRPLAVEAAQSNGERDLLIVADPKQSIYGWRGGEPGILDAFLTANAIEPARRHRIFRSSRVVLDAVNAVFEYIGDNSALTGHADAAQQWARDFVAHRAAFDKPGYARLAVGPSPDSRADFDAATAERAAEMIRDIAAEAPGFSVGVLVRDNKAVRAVRYRLQQLDVPASEEGGNPLTDSPAVQAVLSLLKLADHPADRLAAYHVARSPLGPIVGLNDYRHATEVRRLTADVRRRLVTAGYGPTLHHWTHQLASSCHRRDLARLLQLVELGWQYDADATVRPTDFIATVENTRLDDPAVAPVRVMTVHQAKGLEFDIVVLPELDLPMIRPDTTVVFDRAEVTGPITAIAPASPKLRPLIDALDAVTQAHEARQIRDALSVLYVGMTRARYALHMLIKPPTRSDTALTFARVLRQGLVPDEQIDADDPELWSLGDASWMHAPGAEPSLGAEPVEAERAGLPAPQLAPSSGARRRIVPRTSPSQLEGGHFVDVARRMKINRTDATRRGSVIHAWCELVEWIEDGPPSDESLNEQARHFDLDAERKQALQVEFAGMLNETDVREALSRTIYPDDVELELHREKPFAVRIDDSIVTGSFDRLVVMRRDGRVVGAEVIDFKTDRTVGGVDELVEHYRPQIDAYRRAAAKLYHLDALDISARLVFLTAGEVRSLLS